VVLADDHELMRHTLRQLLDAEPGLEVIAEADDVASALRAAGTHRPNVLVVGLNLSDPRTRRELRGASPATRIVVLASDDSPVRVQQTLAGGAVGYVLKQLADSELPEAVRAAAAGEEFLSPRLRERLDEFYVSLTDERLTLREVQVLRLIALGHTSVEIAHSLGLSPRTIETHRANIHRKLELTTRAELVRYALSRGLLRA
jgi:two-component system response regulator NreC